MADYYYTNGGSERRGFLSNIPEVTKNLLIINVIMFIATLVNDNFMIAKFAMFYPTSPYFHGWQVVTHMFMHGNTAHIFFNMYSLFLFGSVIERVIGTRKFIIYYMVCGLGAAALHTFVQWAEVQVLMNQMADGSLTAAGSYAHIKMTPVLGASGAVYGLLIAYGMLFPNNRMTLIFPPVTLDAKWMVLVFAVIELITGVTGTMAGIAHFAHLGGMLFGWMLIKYWRNKGNLYNRY